MPTVLLGMTARVRTRAAAAVAVLSVLAGLLSLSTGSPNAGAVTATARWSKVRVVQLGSGTSPHQVLTDNRHHRLYVATVGNLEVVNEHTGRVVGRPMDIAHGMFADKAGNLVYVLTERDVVVVRGQRVLGRIRLGNRPLNDGGLLNDSAVVDPKDGWLYLAFSRDDDEPVTLLVLNGTRVLARIPAGVGSQINQGPAVSPIDGHVYVPEGGDGTPAGLLDVAGSRVVRTVPVRYPASGVAFDPSDGNTYVEGGGFYLEVLHGAREISTTRVGGGDPEQIVVNRAGTAYVSGTGSNGDKVSVVDNGTVIAHAPGEGATLDASTQQAYALSRHRVTVFAGDRVINTVKVSQRSFLASSWYDPVAHEMLVFGVHRVLVFRDGVVVQRLNAGRLPCAAAQQPGSPTLNVISCGDGLLTRWTQR